MVDLTVTDPVRPDRRLVDDLSLSVAAGEVLGLAGLRGSGTSTLLHALFGNAGAVPPDTIHLGDSPVSVRSPADAIAQGIVLLTADRRQSVVGEMSVLHNVSLSSAAALSRLGWVDSRREREEVSQLLNRLAVGAQATDAQARTLSGGNQQKVALARCLMTKPRVLLLDEPTRGIDVGAKADVYELIRKLATEGVAILLCASETEELVELSHRVLVLYEGRRSAMLQRHELESDRILRAAMGGAHEAA